MTLSGENYYNAPDVVFVLQGKLTLSVNINETVKSRIEAALHILEAAT